MKKKWLKKGSAVLLAAAMVLSLIPGMKGTLATVQAAENETPTSGYWTDAEGLKNFGISSTKTIGKIKFGLNGNDARLWAICGADGSNLALLSTSAFEIAAYGNTSEYSTSNFVTGMDKYLTLDYFSIEEKTKMADVTVKTNEPNCNGGNEEKTVTNKKLYLPNSLDQSSYGQKTIYVGSSNNIAIDVTKLNGVGLGNLFWLRSPNYDNSDCALVAYPGDFVYNYYVNDNFVSVVPAFNLNLSDVSFASAAEAASSSYSGYKENSGMTENTYTLRYTYTTGTDSAVISSDGTKVTVTNAKGKYLMVQNRAGVYAMAIDSDSKTVNASDITMGNALDNFNNCKVWIESTDADRITTAKMAVTAINFIKITDITSPSAESAFDTEAACATTGVSTTTPKVTWTPNDTTAGYNTTYTASVTLTAEAGYEFASNVTATVNGQNATSVTKNADGTATVTYIFPETAPAPAPTPTYTITAGAGGTHELSTDGTLTITCDGALDKLTGIYVDDKLVDAANYTLKSGSTILTLKAEYLNTLSVGTHKVKFQYSDGSAESTFVIKAASSQDTTTQDTTTSDTTQDTTAPSEKDDAPKAGDSTPIAWLFIIAVISGAGVVYFGRKKKTVR